MPTLLVEWDGESFVPVGRSAKEADAHFVVGRRYRMTEELERSGKAHRFFFACVDDAWANMSEEMHKRWPSPHHLRSWALIKTGYCTQRTLVCASNEDALRYAAFYRDGDPYSVIVVSDDVVTVYTAKSQAGNAMDKKEFARSSDAVLHEIAQIIGCRPEDLGHAA